MRLLQSIKSVFYGLGKGTALALVLLVGVGIGVLMIVARPQPDMNDLKEAKLQYTVQYIKAEQARLGIDCHALRQTLQDFLINDIRPALNARQLGQDWNRNFSQGVRDRMEKLDDYYFACGRIYRAAQTVQWDEFSDMDFSVALEREIITLNTLIRFGEFGEKCDASCLDGNFSELKDAVDEIDRKINSKKVQESNSTPAQKVMN